MLIETCPYNIGIAVKGKEMDIFFERGTTIPATKTFSYTTLYDRQRYAQIAVYEGNAEAVSDNHKLGTFLLEIEPMQAGEATPPPNHTHIYFYFNRYPENRRESIDRSGRHPYGDRFGQTKSNGDGNTGMQNNFDRGGSKLQEDKGKLSGG